MKRFTLYAILVALLFGISAQAKTVIHRMHVWKGGYSTNYLIENEIDSITFSSEELTLELTEDFVTLRVDETHQLLANVPVATWTSSNNSIATVSNYGLVTAVAEGYAVVSATTDGVTKTCIIQVVPKDYLTIDGMYIVGEACPMSIYDKNATSLLMDQGINEVYQEARYGMYEKYIYLEANKDFEFILKSGSNMTHFGAYLTYGENMITTDYFEIPGYKGGLQESISMQVRTSGLYHIIVDLNKDGMLTNLGGAQCLIVPVCWGVRGIMNGWGFTEGELVTNNTWEWNVIVKTPGTFKFAHNNAWKIYVDIASIVKANSNLGVDCVPTGGDIPIEQRGEYRIILQYIGPAATTKESFRYTINKTAELPEIDPSISVYSFIGTVNGNWDTDIDFTFVSKNGNHYVFEVNNLDFDAGEFKIRVNHDWSRSFGIFNMIIRGVDVSGDYGNVMLLNPFRGTAKFEFDWNGWEEQDITLTFYPQ